MPRGTVQVKPISALLLKGENKGHSVTVKSDSCRVRCSPGLSRFVELFSTTPKCSGHQNKVPSPKDRQQGTNLRPPAPGSPLTQKATPTGGDSFRLLLSAGIANTWCATHSLPGVNTEAVFFYFGILFLPEQGGIGSEVLADFSNMLWNSTCRRFST